MLQLEKILKQSSFQRQCINNIKYIKRLIINKKIINLVYNSKYNQRFYSEWYQNIFYDLNRNENWRKEQEGKSAEPMIDLQTLEMIFTILAENKRTILEIGSYDGYFIKYYNCFDNISMVFFACSMFSLEAGPYFIALIIGLINIFPT